MLLFFIQYICNNQDLIDFVGVKGQTQLFYLSRLNQQTIWPKVWEADLDLTNMSELTK